MFPEPTVFIYDNWKIKSTYWNPINTRDTNKKINKNTVWNVEVVWIHFVIYPYITVYKTTKKCPLRKLSLRLHIKKKIFKAENYTQYAIQCTYRLL